MRTAWSQPVNCIKIRHHVALLGELTGIRYTVADLSEGVSVFSSYNVRFIRRPSVVSNAIQTIDNETAYLIIYCFNCIRRDGNSTYKNGPWLVGKEKFCLDTGCPKKSTPV